MKNRIARIISVIAIIEFAYLVLANLALNLPLMQELLNQHRPEKYAVYWERAWTWYPLRFHARGISANGQTSSQQWQMDVSMASASLSYTTRGGPFTLTDGEADVKASSLLVNDEPAIDKGGSMQGHFAIAPFVPSENRGVKSLGFLSADVQVNAQVNSLDFLDIYIRRFNELKLDGQGTWEGRLRYDQGDLMAATDMNVSTFILVLDAPPYRVQGTGDISISVRTGDPESLSMEILFGTLNAYHNSARTPMFSGEKLLVGVQGDNRILPDDQRKTGHGQVTVKVPRVAVLDLSAYQYLLPDRWRARLNGGTGELTGQAVFSSSALSADLRLQSDNADLAFKDYRFVTSLDLGVTARGGTSDTASFDLSGTFCLCRSGLKASRSVRTPTSLPST